MARSADDPLVWHSETITAATEDTLRAFRDRSLLGDAYLAVETGLSLRFGHRRSVDLDFFIGNLFDEEALVQQFQATPGFSLIARAPHTSGGQARYVARWPE